MFDIQQKSSNLMNALNDNKEDDNLRIVSDSIDADCSKYTIKKDSK